MPLQRRIERRKIGQRCPLLAPFRKEQPNSPYRLVVNFHAKHSSEGTIPNAHSADQINTNVNNGNKQAVGFAGFNRNAQGLTHRIASVSGAVATFSVAAPPPPWSPRLLPVPDPTLLFSQLHGSRHRGRVPLKHTSCRSRSCG